MARLEGLKLLLVEDSEDSALLIQAIFRDAIVTTVNDGETALNLALCDLFEIILLDLQLPVKSGFEVLRQLRLAGITKPIIVTSAHAYESDVRRALELGATSYITKPFTPRDILLEVLRHTGRLDDAALRSLGQRKDGERPDPGH